MPGSVHALLVGIDDYGGRVPTLAGTHHDVLGFERWLEARVPQGELHVRRLLDGEATRQAVVDGFTQHLAQAGEGDVAVFCFSGHGSEEPVAPRHWAWEPSGKNQTLVLADSRRPGVPDLADKELNELVRRVADGGAHVLLLLDCCHSGGASRGLTPPTVRARQAPAVLHPRPDDQYLPEVRARLAPGTRDGGDGGTVDVRPPHVALSACESHQLSLEMPIGETVRGVFSDVVQQALATLGHGATYRDLLGAAAARVRDRVDDQHPVGFAEAPASLDQPVLGGAAQLLRTATVLEHVRGSWQVDAGLVHGVPAPQDGTTSVFAVLPPGDGATGGAQDPSTDGVPPLGQVAVEDVGVSSSTVVPVDGWRPVPGTRYPVVLVDLPLPPARVQLVGDSPAWDAVRTGLRDSPYVREAADGPALAGDGFLAVAGRVDPAAPTAGTRYATITLDAGFLTIARPDASPLTDAVPVGPTAAAKVVRRLEHLARWHLVKRLDNPTSSIAGTVTIDVVPTDPTRSAPKLGVEPLRPADDGEVHLEYSEHEGRWRPPFVHIYLTNGSDRDLYLTLLDLTDRYRCHTALFPVQRVPARTTVAALTGTPIDVTVPAERLAAGGDTVRDWLKVIASEQRFAGEGYELPTLDGVVSRSAARGHGTRSVLDRLSARAVTRDAGDLVAAAAGPVAEWTTATTTLRTVHPGACP